MMMSSEISRFSHDPHEMLQEIVKAAKGSPEKLFSCLLTRGGKGDSSINAANIKRQTFLKTFSTPMKKTSIDLILIR